MNKLLASPTTASNVEVLNNLTPVEEKIPKWICERVNTKCDRTPHLATVPSYCRRPLQPWLVSMLLVYDNLLFIDNRI
jgi:hypothetical protein